MVSDHLPTKTLTRNQIENLLELFRLYKDVFALRDDELSESTTVMSVMKI